MSASVPASATVILSTPENNSLTLVQPVTDFELDGIYHAWRDGNAVTAAEQAEVLRDFVNAGRHEALTAKASKLHREVKEALEQGRKVTRPRNQLLRVRTDLATFDARWKALLADAMAAEGLALGDLQGRAVELHLQPSAVKLVRRLWEATA